MKDETFLFLTIAQDKNYVDSKKVGMGRSLQTVIDLEMTRTEGK